MRPLRILAVAVALAAANCLPGALRAQEQQPSPESMAAAQALFALLFTHGFATLNAQAVEAAFYGTATGTKMLQAMPKVLPEAFASVLPRMQPMMAETQDSFLKLLRERGLLN